MTEDAAPRNDRRTPLLGMTEDAAIPSPPPFCHPERSEGSGPSCGRETRFLVAPLLGMTEEAAPRNDRRAAPRNDRRAALRNEDRRAAPRNDRACRARTPTLLSRVF